jgi:hypothetical protein
MGWYRKLYSHSIGNSRQKNTCAIAQVDFRKYLTNNNLIVLNSYKKLAAEIVCSSQLIQIVGWDGKILLAIENQDHLFLYGGNFYVPYRTKHAEYGSQQAKFT